MLDLYAKHNLPFIMLGDYNSRTSDASDKMPIEKEITRATGYNDDNSNYIEQFNLLQRFNRDKVLNKNGKNLLTLCQTINLKILNSRFGSDKGVGDFTCHKPNGESTVDYIIVSDSLIPNVCEFSVDVLDGTISDVHSPISMSLSPDSTTLHPANPEDVVTSEPSETIIIRWNDDLKTTFKESFSEIDVCQLLHRLNIYDTDNSDQVSMDDINNELANIYIKTAQNIGICKIYKKHTNFKKKKYDRKHPQQDWFDEECENGRREYMDFKNRGRHIKNKQEKKVHKKALSKKTQGIQKSNK